MALDLRGINDVIRPQDYSPTPAIAALQDAFRKGVVSFDMINDRFLKGREDKTKAQQADEAYTASKDAQELQPLVKQAKVGALNSEIEMRPAIKTEAKAALEEAGIQRSIRTDPLSSYFKNMEEAKKDAAEWAIGAEAPKLVSDWHKANIPGAIPRTDDNTIDYSEVEKRLNEAGFYGTSIKSNDQDKALLNEAIKKGLDTSKYFDRNGRALPGAAEAVAQAPQSMTALQREDASIARDSTEALLTSLHEAKDSLAQNNLVGPVIGNVLNPLPFIKSVFGDHALRDGQTRLVMLANELTAEKTRALKGALSEKELKFLQETVPSKDKSEAVWRKFLDDRIALLEKTLARAGSRLGTPAPAASSAPAGTGVAAPTPKSEAEYDALKPGQLYTNHLGKVVSKI